ncbi:MAG TPA: hypothetical protein VMA13_02335 [Candidatus Saccharimonadales bacterium]|nr:hypothetical protein [Candidatus Saccharimonadales bacterium]
MAICWIFLGFFTTKSFALGFPPSVAVPPVGISVQNGGTAIFTVIAYANLSGVSFTWYLNGQPITNANVTVVNTTTNTLIGGILGLVPVSVLTVNNVNSTNAGKYSVKLFNGNGSVTTNATLIVLSTTVTNVINFVSSATAMTADGFKIQLSGPSGSNFVIQASADLKNWIPISTNLAPTGSISYTDAAAKTNTFRFYRALIQ